MANEMELMVKNALSVVTIVLFFVLTAVPTINSVSVGENGSQENNTSSVNIKHLWKQINEDGFGNINNVAPRGIEIFEDCLVIGTTNFNKSQMSWEPRVFFELLVGKWSGNRLSSEGCEIWCYDGENGKKLIGNNDGAIMESGFGNENNWECSVLIEFNNNLYAGLWNSNEGCQIWRTGSLNEEWEMVVERGFGNENNWAAWSAEIFDEYLYIGTMNFKQGCEVYRTNDGVNWSAVVGGTSNITSGFRSKNNNVYSWSMCAHKSQLYVGTDGGELWKSSEGVVWKPVIAYENLVEAKLHGADFPRGFGGTVGRVGGIRRMIVFNDELYLSFLGGNFYLNIIVPNLGKIITLSDKLSSIQRLIHINHGAELWKYNSSEDKWTRVIGGIIWRNEDGGRWMAYEREMRGGFGDPKNVYFWSMEIFDDILYVGTFHPNLINILLVKNCFLNWNISFEIPMGQAQLWRFDGNDWEQCIGDGFEDEYNVGMRAMKTYNNSLIAGVVNGQTGCEIWEYCVSEK